MKAVAVVVARMTSKRLPGKAMARLGGKSNIERHVERLRLVSSISEIFLATSRSSENDELVAEAKRLEIQVYKGEDEDIVERFEGVGKISNADVLVRTSCDKPLFCFDILKSTLEEYNGEDYVYLPKEVMKGVSHELISVSAINKIHEHYFGTAVAQLMREKPHQFDTKCHNVDKVYCRPEYRLDLDTPEDHEMLCHIFDDYDSNHIIHSKDAIAFLDDNPEVAFINRYIEEKNVNSYSSDLETKPIFRVVTNPQGKYIVVDRIGEQIPYLEFLRIVEDPQKWDY